MTAIFGGTPNDSEWPIIASATHVALGSHHYVPVRLVIRENPAGQWLVCIEIESAEGKVTRPAQIVSERSAIYSTMQRVVEQFQLPGWLVDRCLLSMRDSAGGPPNTQPISSAK